MTIKQPINRYFRLTVLCLGTPAPCTPLYRGCWERGYQHMHATRARRLLNI